MEVLLVASNTVVSAYKADETGSYAYSNTKAKTLFKRLQKGISWCTSKNNTPTPFPVLGAVNQHEFTKNKVDYFIKLHHGTLVDAEIRCKEFELHLDYVEKFDVPEGIPYVKETVVNDVAVVADEEEDLNNVPVRSVEEIALEKEDLTWLSKKKYYIVNDDETAEQLFTFLDNYNGMIAYDTETTGLKINCFGKINSDYSRTLEKYNMEHPKETIRADRLVGIIFCVEPDVSYYFPVFNRKFKNLYEDKNSPVRKKIIQNTKSRYTVGDLRDLDSDMARYVRETPEDEWRLDVILMERVRNILTTKHIATHGGIFEWRVGWMFEIDTNICDDSMIMHQLMYKFRSTTSNKGEPSNLKFLAKHELGMDQWELKDFFPNLKEDDSGKARQGSNKKNSGSRIDFSYMDYAGTRVYAPTDGDATLSLCLKYKKDMKENYPEIEYLYSVELLVSCAMGYVEFYGHRINEEKINSARLQTRANIAMLEEEIRQSIEYNSESETAAYDKLKELAKNGESESADYDDRLDKAINELTEAIANNTDKVLNINSPAQVSELFFDKLKYPLSSDGSRSVSKKVYKALAKEVGEDGKPKYPVAGLYGKYKAETTLLQKFFGALPDFMYPDGMIFSDFGQISTATGRMSCKHPNAQQYPKVITKIVVPRKNCIMLDADYSQIEYRVLTALAHNDGLAELFKDPDSDYHTLMASLMYETPYASVTPQMRSAAKSFNFGIPYGMGFGSLAILLHGTKTEANIADAKEKYEMYFKNQPNTRRFFDNIKEQAQVYKYTETLFKRRRYYSFEDKDGNVNNANKARALRQAGNAVIQGTAADIFKIGLARNFNFIRKNKLYGKMFIINLIHDEQLMEVDVTQTNPLKILAEVGNNMQFHVDGFPPLYIGAGVGPAWGYAKGKMAEIHPSLMDTFIEEAKNLPVLKEKADDTKPQDVIDWFQNRVYEFRRHKVIDYIVQKENWEKPLHPAIGSIVNLQFNYGRGDDARAYSGPNGEKYSDAEFLKMNLSDFIAENKLDIDVNTFFRQDVFVEEKVEESDDYDDGDDIEDFDPIEGIADSDRIFSLVDESDKTFGSSVVDLIDVFGACILNRQRICGIDMRGTSAKAKDNMSEYLCRYLCEPTDEGALQVIFLVEGNILNKTGVYVRGISGSEIEAQYKKYFRTSKTNQTGEKK